MGLSKRFVNAVVLSLILLSGLFLEAKMLKLFGQARTIADKAAPNADYSQFSAHALPSGAEKKLSLALDAAVPELDDVYYQMMKDGGLLVVGTASVDGYGNHYALVADMTTRFLQTAYQSSSLPVDFAALYTSYQGRFVMAAGLGRQAASKVTLSTWGGDQGVQLMGVLANLDQYQGAPTTQAFAEYQ